MGTLVALALLATRLLSASCTASHVVPPPGQAPALAAQPALTAKFQPQVATLTSVAADIEQYSWHAFISFAYQLRGTQAWETASPTWHPYCSCVALQPQWCLTTYECVKPLVLYEATHQLRYKVAWKASGWGSQSWQSGVGFVDGYQVNAALGLGLVYLDRSPFSRTSLTNKGALAFAKIAAAAPATGASAIFLGMGQTANGDPAGTLRQKSAVLQTNATAWLSLQSTNYTFGGQTRPLSSLWSVDQPLYPNVLYTDAAHCVGDWAGPLVDSQGQVVGLLLGYPEPAETLVSFAADGGPFVYNFNAANYKYPLACTNASDVFVDVTGLLFKVVTHPAARAWVGQVLAAGPSGGLKVTGPSVDRGDGVYNREILRGSWGPYSFAFQPPPGVAFHQIVLTMNTSLELPSPKVPQVFFNFVHGTTTAPDSVEYRFESNSVVLTWASGVRVNSSASGFQVYPTVPSGYVWGTVIAGSSATQYPGVITVSLNMRVPNDCLNRLFTVTLRSCITVSPPRCSAVQTLSVAGGPGTIPSRCTLCNGCTPLSYPYTEILDLGQQCLTVPPFSTNVTIATCDGSTSQQWMFSGNGFIGHRSGKCLSLGILALDQPAFVDDCDKVAPLLLKPMRVPYRPEFTIQTVGQDYGTPFCLVSQAPVVRKMLCPVAFAERWSANFDPRFYSCANDEVTFLQTQTTLQPSCQCQGAGIGPEAMCG